MDFSTDKSDGLCVEWCRPAAILSVTTLGSFPKATLYLHDYILTFWSVKVIYEISFQISVSTSQKTLRPHWQHKSVWCCLRLGAGNAVVCAAISEDWQLLSRREI
jgi:hypothetical protein